MRTSQGNDTSRMDTTDGGANTRLRAPPPVPRDGLAAACSSEPSGAIAQTSRIRALRPVPLAALAAVCSSAPPGATPLEGALASEALMAAPPRPRALRPVPWRTAKTQMVGVAKLKSCSQPLTSRVAANNKHQNPSSNVSRLTRSARSWPVAEPLRLLRKQRGRGASPRDRCPQSTSKGQWRNRALLARECRGWLPKRYGCLGRIWLAMR